MAKSTSKNALQMFDDIQKIQPPVQAKEKTEVINEAKPKIMEPEILPDDTSEEEPAKEVLKSDISIDLHMERKAKKIPKSIYIEEELNNKIVKLAKKNGVAYSDVISNILKQVLC